MCISHIFLSSAYAPGVLSSVVFTDVLDFIIGYLFQTLGHVSPTETIRDFLRSLQAIARTNSK
jgi:hypothetical protein